MKYVLGFIFDGVGQEVLLMRKNRPTWQAGMLNGIGGKIENDEEPLQAMIRETDEETNAIVPWSQYGSVGGIPEVDDWEVHLFYGFYDGKLSEIQAKTDEKLEVHSVDKLPNDVIRNLHWLIPMALKDQTFYAVVAI